MWGNFKLGKFAVVDSGFIDPCSFWNRSPNTSLDSGTCGGGGGGGGGGNERLAKTVVEPRHLFPESVPTPVNLLLPGIKASQHCVAATAAVKATNR